MKQSLLLSIVILALSFSSILGQSMTPKKYPVLKDYYGIRVYHQKKHWKGGTVEEDFLSFTGKEYKPEVYFEGYNLFQERHYLALLDKIYPIVRSNEVIEMLEDDNLRMAIAKDIADFVASGIEPGESSLTVSIRLSPNKKSGPVYFSIFPISDEGSIKLRIYDNGTAGANYNYMAHKRPMSTGYLNERETEEYNEILEEAFWGYIDELTEGIYEIGLEDTMAYQTRWQ